MSLMPTVKRDWRRKEAGFVVEGRRERRYLGIDERIDRL
jgi:hypothetical protein